MGGDGARVPLGIKLAYAIGRCAEAVKGRAFETFLFFYYVQVLGLPGSLSGLAVGIALFFDALTDPLAGWVSDGWRSRWGRRHPFMFAAPLPLAIFFYLLFIPPDGLPKWQLFAWLTCFAVLTRAAMTLFHVPHLALGAELSSDYIERTQIVAFRSFAGIVGSALAGGMGLFYFFASTPEFEKGQMNAGAYPGFAAFCALLMVAAILVCVVGTRKTISALPTPSAAGRSYHPFHAYRGIYRALKNASFRALFVGVVLIAIAAGAHSTMLLHIGTFFFALSSEQIGYYVPVMATGALLAVPVTGVLHRRFDKKPTFIVVYTGALLISISPVLLRLVELFPGNDHPLLLPILLLCMGVSTFGGVVGGITAGSMMADIADEHELETGEREEGIFFGALAFSGKTASAMGHAVAGIGLDLIRWPRGGDLLPADIPADTIWNLGFFFGPTMTAFGVAALVFFSRYRLSRSSHATILAELRERRGELGARERVRRS
jgi:Na+/melibiose symporter-like transporter